MANYKLSELAADDIAQIFDFGIDTFGLNAASNYIEGMTVRLQQLAEHPLQYQAVDDIREGYRRSLYGSHAIYYRINANGIDVMRILRNQDTGIMLFENY